MSILKNCSYATRFSHTHNKFMTYMGGNIYNDNRFTDGTYVRTTAIIHINGNEVTTSSGSKYIIESDAEDISV